MTNKGGHADLVGRLFEDDRGLCRVVGVHECDNEAVWTKRVGGGGIWAHSAAYVKRRLVPDESTDTAEQQ